MSPVFRTARQVFSYKDLRRNEYGIAIYVVSIYSADSLDARFDECFEPAPEATSNIDHAARMEQLADHARNCSCGLQRVLELPIKKSPIVDTTKFMCSI
jgi:hypothetical protein